MAKFLLIYVIVLSISILSWFFMSSIFSKIGTPFTKQYKNFKNDMEEK